MKRRNQPVFWRGEIDTYGTNKMTHMGQIFLINKLFVILQKTVGVLKRFYLLLAMLFTLGCSQIPVVIDYTSKYWTVMVYAAADCDLESNLLIDVEELKRGTNNNVNIVVLIDRSEKYSDDASVFGENFSDTRLYLIISKRAIRLDGKEEFPEITRNSNYEANMGDPITLKKFINYCKKQFPADNYALVMGGHGDGARSRSTTDVSRAISIDENADGYGNSDLLFIGEITDHLTNKESVNLLVLDACLMGTIEVAYQFRPNINKFGAEFLVASPPKMWGPGLKYDAIFSRISESAKAGYYSSQSLTPLDFGTIIIEEQAKIFEKHSKYDSALSLFDLSKSVAVKESIDDLSKSLYLYKNELEKIRGAYYKSDLIHYFDLYYSSEWLDWPYFDLYDLCSKIAEYPAFPENVKRKALDAMLDIDEFVVASYAGAYYSGFVGGKNGVSIFFPNGALNWKEQYWYNAIRTQGVFGGGEHYGALDWCADGAAAGNNTVENWFELLDSFFDETNDSSGGVNGYQY
ncbi:MAG TPA: clostripain [Spirochaetota bacterium]|jgi:clostripain|nr:clostripain [Spirochaetota bacterium]HPY88217.1 clostripain [Spirochaetota bacterium]HQB61758.1 clostripain [Spirochaetota bacterium]